MGLFMRGFLRSGGWDGEGGFLFLGGMGTGV